MDVDKNRAVVKCFRYAPLKWQRLAHLPGGIPFALSAHYLAWILLPGFLISLFMASFILARRVDIVHANWSITGAIAGLAARIARRPIVTTIRGEDVGRSAKSIAYRYILWCCIALSQRIVAVGEEMCSTLLEEFPSAQGKIVYIPNGVHETFFFDAEEKSQDDSAVKILYLGNLIPVKGVDVLVQACSKIGNMEWNLDVVGSGGELCRLQELAKALSLDDRIEFIGKVPPQDVPDCLRKADIVVLPSYREGRSNVLVEAMATGCAVVASDIGGLRELINDGKSGLLFRAGDVEDLASKLDKLLADGSLRKKCGESAKRSIKDRELTWTNTAYQYSLLYKEILNEYHSQEYKK